MSWTVVTNVLSLETPTVYAKGKGVWTFYGSATINAPASQVYDVLCDFANYNKWNLYTPEIITPSGNNTIKLDDIITLKYRPETKGKLLDVPCQISVIEDGSRLCWIGQAFGIPTWIFLPEKVHRVTPRGENACFVEIYETQGGPMAYIVKWSMGEQLMRYAQGMVDSLKKYVEEQAVTSSLFASGR